MHDYFFVGEGGELFDTRKTNWTAHPIRRNYSISRRELNTVADVKAALRAGEFAWPGGYQMFFITADGAPLSFQTVRAEFHHIVWDIRNKCSTGWRVCAVDINYEDGELFDAHTGERIPAAYCDD